MRRFIAAVSLAALLAVSMQSGSPAAGGACTKTGTDGSDTMFGTGSHDVICALKGADYANGRDSSDLVRGGQGQDTVVGGDGRDELRGGPNNDELFATDGNTGEIINGRRGKDRCYGDAGDTFLNCEHIVRVQ